jgi:hypothetical protein
MSVQRPQELVLSQADPPAENVSPADMAAELGVAVVAHDAERDVVEHEQLPTSQIPDDVDPGDFLEQSVIVDYDEDDYR